MPRQLTQAQIAQASSSPRSLDEAKEQEAYLNASDQLKQEAYLNASDQLKDESLSSYGLTRAYTAGARKKVSLKVLNDQERADRKRMQNRLAQAKIRKKLNAAAGSEVQVPPLQLTPEKLAQASPSSSYSS